KRCAQAFRFQRGRKRKGAWLGRLFQYRRQLEVTSGSVTLDFTKQCRKLCRLIGNGTKAQPLQGASVKTAKVEALVSIHVPATRNERGSWPECFCMLNSCVQLE